MENSTAKLNQGDSAPEFSLTEAGGDQFSLASALDEGSSLLLVFAHGSDCGVCQQQLKEFQDNIEKFEDRGIRPVVITPRPIDYNQELKELAGLDLFVLSDDGTVAERYGVVEQNSVRTTLMLVDRHGTISWIYGGACQPSMDWPTLEYIFRHMVIARGV
jgi:peroxiredoxin